MRLNPKNYYNKFSVTNLKQSDIYEQSRALKMDVAAVKYYSSRYLRNYHRLFLFKRTDVYLINGTTVTEIVPWRWQWDFRPKVTGNLDKIYIL